MEPMSLPPSIRKLLHDCDTAQVTWEANAGFLIDRVLSSSNWAAICELRAQLSDSALRARIEATEGRKLSPRQLTFWQHVLNLDPERVKAWLADENRSPWDKRRS